MSAEQYAPGHVQVVLSLHPSRVQELASWMINHSRDGSRLREVGEQIKAQGHGKRLVIIDPEDLKQVAALARALRNTATVEAALRSLLAPPTSECPEGCTVVVDGANRLWIARDDGLWESGTAFTLRTWDELIRCGPLRPVGPVLSAGIEEAE